jgi:hypothetical protein
VLEEIEAAVESRLPDEPRPVRKRDRVRIWLLNKVSNGKRMFTDRVELANLRRKLQEVENRFMVRILLTLDVTDSGEFFYAFAGVPPHP